jgi:hypothetical protein
LPALIAFANGLPGTLWCDAEGLEWEDKPTVAAPTPFLFLKPNIVVWLLCICGCIVRTQWDVGGQIMLNQSLSVAGSKG